MSKKFITFHESNRSPLYAGQTFEMFHIRFDYQAGEYVQDEKGEIWGINNPVDGRPMLVGKADEWGIITDYDPREDQPTTVHHLVAENLMITPETGVLGADKDVDLDLSVTRPGETFTIDWEFEEED